MSIVVLAGARRAYRNRLPQALETLKTSGAELHLVTFGDPPPVEVSGRQVTLPVPGRTWLTRLPAVMRPLVRVITLVFRQRATDHFRRAVLSSPDVATLVAAADVVVAVDAPAIDAAWHLARRYPAAAVVGAAAALEALARPRSGQ